MDRIRRKNIFGFISGLVILWATGSFAETALEYQRRVHRYEGIKPKPVSGYDIELISLLVDYREEATPLIDQFKVKFYLKKSIEVNLIVRELDPRYFYLMDRVSLDQPWQSNSWNTFKWPTGEVIKHLEGIRIYDLGVVARLGKPVPGKVERVAPVAFYHSKPPPEIPGYLFTFKTSGDAHLSFRIYKEGETTALFQTFRKPRGGRAFTIRWDSSAELEGTYKLVINGYFLDTNDPIGQIVYFYHQPGVDH
jgi:hypothetical protein